MLAAMKTIAIKIMSTKKFINIDQRMEDKNMLGNTSPWMKLKTLKDDEGNFEEINEQCRKRENSIPLFRCLTDEAENSLAIFYPLKFSV